ncbi:MAG: 16S rRNA (guanine(527)-N(7))-methyltransferase RsmG [Defluviitaleaceae bacterium]|nr:16S rRNA (guanine(527)-N(7))-methyltransferase RsmG [Defluviitaleaceae bacterium]
MTEGKIAPILSSGAGSLGIALPQTALSAFEKYYELLEARRQTVNLTAITGAESVARLHFLDSLALINFAQLKGARVIDIGSGAGIPGIPLKIAEPSVDIALLDSTGKRVAFLTELCAALGLDAKCLHARAEEAAHEQCLRENFDVAVSRAVARLGALCELCLPFVRAGGLFIAMKGADSDAEITASDTAIAALGAELQEIVDYIIPGTDVSHRAVLIRKTSNTPEKYPRRFARINKAPL